MAYLIEGENHPVVYCSNFEVGSVPTATTLLDMGAVQVSGHWSGQVNTPKSLITVQTVRNHFDVISSLSYSEDKPCNFEDYINTILDGHHARLNPKAFYGFYGKWDYILSYDNLQFEFDTLCLFAGLPYAKIDIQPEQYRWQNLFTTSLHDKVAERYSEELERIGYGVS